MVQKKTYTRALPVYASDNAFLANPALLILSGTSNVATSSDFLVTNIDITDLGIRAGDVVINLSTGKSATATSEPFAGNLLALNADIFTVGNQLFAIYQGDQNSASKAGCVLYVSQNGSCNVITLGGDQVELLGLVAGTIIPIQVIKVLETNYNTALVSLW